MPRSDFYCSKNCEIFYFILRYINWKTKTWQLNLEQNLKQNVHVLCTLYSDQWCILPSNTFCSNKIRKDGAKKQQNPRNWNIKWEKLISTFKIRRLRFLWKVTKVKSLMTRLRKDVWKSRRIYYFFILSWL